MREMAIFSGTAHPELAGAICHHLEVQLSPSRCTRFTNDCLEVQLQANCRERDVFLIQPLVPPVQEHLVELLLMIDAARGASSRPRWRNATRVVAPQSMSVCGGPWSGPNAKQVWHRPPEPKASPLPTTVTITSCLRPVHSPWWRWSVKRRALRSRGGVAVARSAG